MHTSSKRIAISQRYDQVQGRNEWRDCLDSRWAELLCQLGAVPILIPNNVRDVDSYLADLAISGLILSGGNDIGSAPLRDATETNALAYANKHKLPVLGVCRGMQFLCVNQGGVLHACEGHVSKYHKLKGDWATQSRLSEVNSYHNHAVFTYDCPALFEILATTENEVVEAFRHKSKPWLGIMWHPERENPLVTSDLNIIKQHFGL
ncbi:gamma-glutamyl-gamma-aminobutyrate hydrolase family protein [Rheinheimera maricola]|uniref:Gamma-glutamyl-gamma-aminobutyrate hydrolase family protein n=1 Tax=Rheinheimera maricola TaxID=2793282 RepID=A0ABS7X6S7_9GAMM|nr:gamma-glutamyl-gamma-aminobutyrate hydrolase family protein [Rheinheimera maricola]MBZ9610322.1 gamma-glutamyl-gamma-aminobutyrate hydrolase family protein [Rheinheimera maricola]